MNSIVQVILGGIGDTILSLDNIKKEYPLHIYTHSNKKAIYSLIKELDLHSNPEVYSMGDIKNAKYQAYQVKKIKYISWKFSEDLQQKTLERLFPSIKDNYIIFHPFGSEFSSSWAKAFNLPTKDIPNESINLILDILYKFNLPVILTGTKKEFDNLNIDNSKVNKLILDDSIDGLVVASKCKFFIGSDSAIKTLTASNKIKSIVFVADYEDEIRDKFFIGPYKADNIIKEIRYNNFDKSFIESIQLEKIISDFV